MTQKHNLVAAAIALALINSPVFAGNYKPEPKPTPEQNTTLGVGLGLGLGLGVGSADSTSVSQANSESTASANANAGAVSDSHADATGGFAIAKTGDNAAHAQAGDSQAIGGDVSVQYSSQYAAQVPTMVQGSIVVPGCGAGMNAGHADTRNASFFGIAWTTDKCYTMMLGSAWASIGEYALACEMWADVGRKALKRRRITNLDCDEIAARLYQQQIEVGRARNPQNPVTPAYVAEVVDRAFKRAVQK